MILGLLVTDGPKKGIYLQFAEGKPFWLGRAETADFRLEGDPRISGKHCCFLKQEEQLSVEDFSTNGIRLNGRKIHHTQVALKNADLLCIGKTHLQVVDLENTPHQETEYNFDACLEDFRLKQHGSSSTEVFPSTPPELEYSKNSPEQRLLAVQNEEEASSPAQHHTQRLKRFTEDPERFDVLGPYFIIDLIGSGAFGKVYKALHQERKIIVALKVFQALEEFDSFLLQRAKREIQLLKKLKHPAIIQIYEEVFTLEKEKLSFIALEYFPGVDLSLYVKINGVLPWPKVVKMFSQILEGLDYMHCQSVLHRDLKPHNILYQAGKEKLKIIDLGIGKCLEKEEQRTTHFTTRPGSALGTPDFMPIEQWRDVKSVDQRADIYALGATLYFLLTQQTPHGQHHDLASLYTAISQKKRIPLESLVSPEVPKELIAVINKMMAFSAVDRYATTTVLRKELQSLKWI